MRLKIAFVFLLISSAIASAQPVNDPAARVAALPCDLVSDVTLQKELGTSRAPLGIPLFQWTPDLWVRFEERATSCIQQHQNGALGLDNLRNIHRMLVLLQSSRKYAFDEAVKKEGVRAAEAIGAAREKERVEAEAASRIASDKATTDRLLAEADAPNLTSTEMSARVQRYSASLNENVLSGTDGGKYRLALNNLKSMLEAARQSEADAWERERPSREAEAAARTAEIARLEKVNKEKQDAEEAARAQLAKIEELKTAAAELERSRLARLEEERLAPAREAAKAKMEAADLAAAKAEQEELKKPLSCDNLDKRFLAYAKANAGEKMQMDLATASLVGDKKSICKTARSLVEALDPFHKMAIDCKNLGVGYSANNLLSAGQELLHEQGC